MKEPFWIIGKYTIQLARNNNYPILRLIYLWLRTQIFYLKQLYFKKCNYNKRIDLGHFFGENFVCLRCKKHLTQIEIEKNRGFKK